MAPAIPKTCGCPRKKFGGCVTDLELPAVGQKFTDPDGRTGILVDLHQTCHPATGAVYFTQATFLALATHEYTQLRTIKCAGRPNTWSPLGDRDETEDEIAALIERYDRGEPLTRLAAEVSRSVTWLMDRFLARGVRLRTTAEAQRLWRAKKRAAGRLGRTRG
jgi:hypothetical protein